MATKKTTDGTAKAAAPKTTKTAKAKPAETPESVAAAHKAEVAAAPSLGPTVPDSSKVKRGETYLFDTGHLVNASPTDMGWSTTQFQTKVDDTPIRLEVRDGHPETVVTKVMRSSGRINPEGKRVYDHANEVEVPINKGAIVSLANAKLDPGTMLNVVCDPIPPSFDKNNEYKWPKFRVDLYCVKG